MSQRPTTPHPPAARNRALISIISGLQRRRAQATVPDEEPRALTAPGERIVRGGRVLYFPAPNGTVRIVGISETGEWIAEFACRERDFDEKYVRRMTQHVAVTTGVHIAVV